MIILFALLLTSFFFLGGGSSKKIRFMRGGQGKNIRLRGGAIICYRDYLPNPTSPPYPIKNERSLGVEHVMANVEKKLEELHFPPTQKRQIIDDIFGGPRTVSSRSLCESKSNEEFDNKVSEMKERREEIEKKYTRNAPPKFVKYFSQHKEEKIRNSMTQYVRKRAGVDGVYGQNPIE